MRTTARLHRHHVRHQSGSEQRQDPGLRVPSGERGEQRSLARPREARDSDADCAAKLQHGRSQAAGAENGGYHSTQPVCALQQIVSIVMSSNLPLII